MRKTRRLTDKGYEFSIKRRGRATTGAITTIAAALKLKARAKNNAFLAMVKAMKAAARPRQVVPFQLYAPRELNMSYGRAYSAMMPSVRKALDLVLASHIHNMGLLDICDASKYGESVPISAIHIDILDVIDVTKGLVFKHIDDIAFVLRVYLSRHGIVAIPDTRLFDGTKCRLSYLVRSKY